MSAREVITESATIGFGYGFVMAIIALIQTNGDIKKSATCGTAISVGMTALNLSASFFAPKSERLLLDKSAGDHESDTDKYINERTKESN